MAWYDVLFVAGLVLVAVGWALAWTTARSVFELIVGDDRREVIGSALVRLGVPVLFVGATAHVIVQLS